MIGTCGPLVRVGAMPGEREGEGLTLGCHRGVPGEGGGGVILWGT